MRYVGGLIGGGVLKCNGEVVARASYDFDGFFDKTIGLTSCGEIRASPAALKGVFGRKNVQLLTDDGQLLGLRFSGKALPPASSIAHVDVTGALLAARRN
jgi:hypothetical protein